MTAPPRLGRGLASLLGDGKPNSANASAGMTAIDLLEPNPFQPRGTIDDDALAELADSIRQQGVLQPVLIRRHPTLNGRFQLIAGERRWRAAALAGLTSIPSYIRDLTDTAASAAALVENLQRQDLNAIEEAEGYRRLLDEHGLTQDELARAIGKSRSHVANLLRLLNLPESVLTSVRNGELTAGHARAALAFPDPQAAADMMIARGLSVRQAERLAADDDGSARQPAPKPESSADLRSIEAELSEHLGLRVAISGKGQSGTVTLRYQTLDQLDHLIARLGR